MLLMTKHNILFLLVLSVISLQAAEYRISTPAALTSALNAVQPGDTITILKGTYTNWDIEFTANGTSSAKIYLRADSIGGVILTGTSSLSIGGQYLVVDGLTFTNGYIASGNVIEFRNPSAVGSSYCRLTNTSIVDYSNPDTTIDSKWISLYGYHNRVDHCYLKGKKNLGTTLVVWLDANPNYHQIDSNYFGYRPVLGMNGGETIRVGTSDWSQYDSYTTVEYNLFEQCNGEIETVSNKSCGNIYRYNTFVSCQGTLTLRHGNRCSVYGNFFFANHASNSGGIRIIGEDHLVYNNYISGTSGSSVKSALTIMNGIPDSPLSGYYQVKRAVVTFNTLVDNVNNFNIGAYGDTTATLPPLDCTIGNNIIYGTTSPLVRFNTQPVNMTWRGNIIYGATTGFTTFPDSNNNVNPNLAAADANGVRHLSSSSTAAINKSLGTYNYVTTDIDGETRDANKDIGSDEYSTSSPIIKPITTSDVGPKTPKSTSNVITANPGSYTWNSTAAWAGGAIPGAAADVIIPSGSFITISTSTTVLSTTVNSGGSLTLSASVTLNGNIINNGTISGSGYVLTTNGDITISGTTASLVFSSNSGGIVGTASKTFTLANGATFEFAKTGSTALASAVSNSSGTWTWVVNNSPNNTTITYKNNSSTTVITALPNSQSYGNLGMKSPSSASSDWADSLGASLTISGNLIITNTTVAKLSLDMRGFTLTGSGSSSIQINNTGGGSVGLMTQSSTTDFTNLFPGFTPVTTSTFTSYSFTNSGNQTIPGGTYTNLSVSGNGGTKTFSGNVTVTGTFSRGGGATTLPTLSFGAYTLTYGAGATLEYTITGVDQSAVGSEWPATNGPANLKISTSRILTLSESRTITGYVNKTIASSATTGGFIKSGSAGTLNYASGAYLIFNTNGSSIPKLASTDYSNCKDIRLNAIGTANYVNTWGSLTFGSDVTITLMGACNLKIDLAASGAGPAVFTHNGTIVFAGTGTVIDGTLSTSGDNFTLGSSGTLKTNIATGINGCFANAGTTTLPVTANYEFNGSTTQATGTMLPSTVNQLTLNNSAGITITRATTVSATLTLGGNGSYTGLSNIVNVPNIIYSATTAQTTGSELGAAVSSLSINNANGVTLGSSTTINGILGLSSGRLTLGSNSLTLGTASIITGTPSSSAMIVATGTGKLVKLIADAQTLPYTFTLPVGDNTSTPEYSPVTCTLNSGTLSSASIAIQVVNVKHANNTTSSDYLKRFWTLSGSGITNPDYSATFTFLPSDVEGTESLLLGGFWNGASWTGLGAVNASRHTFTTTEQTAFGDFTAGSGSDFSGIGHVIVKVIPQGFYNTGGYLNTADTIGVYLANSGSPYNSVDSSFALLDSPSFSATAFFNSAASGNYYLVIKHRNSIETWSASPIAFIKGSTVSYDFTDAQEKAYGGNQVQVSSSPELWAIYSGDVNQDGYVDPLDISLIDQDSFNYASGTGIKTDINGDHFVDPLDLSIADVNSFNYIGLRTPFSARIASSLSKKHSAVIEKK
jgi:poly(beta-D-mannuronate) lyase